MELFVIQLQERYFNLEFWEFTLSSTHVQFIKNKLKDSRYNSNLFEWHANRWSSSHCMCFSRTSLSICQDCCVVPIKTAKYQISCAFIKDLLLGFTRPKYWVEVKAFTCNLELSIFLVVFRWQHAFFTCALANFSTNKWSDSDSNCNWTRVL